MDDLSIAAVLFYTAVALAAHVVPGLGVVCLGCYRRELPTAAATGR